MKKGVTLIEILIAMTMASVVFLIVSSVLAMILFNSVKNKRQEAFEQVKNDIRAELTNAVRWGTAVSIDNGDLLVDGTTYKMANGQLWKNDQPLSSSAVEVNHFEMNNLSSDANFVSLKIEILLRSHANPLVTDALQVVVSQRKTEMEAQ